MQPGQVSEPVRTPSGFHIVRLNEQRGAEEQVMVNQVHARHILMRPNELQDDETVKQKLEALRKRILAGEDFAGLASSDLGRPGFGRARRRPRLAGAGTFVPEFEGAIAALAGERDQRAVPAPSTAGTSCSCSARRMYDNTDEVRRQHAFAALREGKADEETELWLRRLRDEAFIEYKM